MFKGTRYIDTQISQGLCNIQQLPELTDKLMKVECVKDYVSSLSQKSFTHPMPDPLPNYGTIGRAIQIHSDTIKEMSKCNTFPSYQELQYFARGRVAGKIYNSQSYSRSKVSNSYTVRIVYESRELYGYVFAFASTKDMAMHYAVINLFTSINKDAFGDGSTVP